MKQIKALFLFVFGLVLFQPTDSQAQVPLRSYGVKAGLVSSGIYTSPEWVYPGQNRRYGFEALVFAEWFGRSFFSIVTEIGYVQRGYHESLIDTRGLSDEIVRSEANSRLDYLSTSVLAKFRHFGEENATGYAFIGPRFGIVINRSAGTLRNAEETIQSPIAENYDSWSAGGTIGLGLEVDSILPETIFLEASYDLDLTNSLSEKTLVIYEPSGLEYEARRISAINHAFRVALGIML